VFCVLVTIFQWLPLSCPLLDIMGIAGTEGGTQSRAVTTERVSRAHPRSSRAAYPSTRTPAALERPRHIGERTHGCDSSGCQCTLTAVAPKAKENPLCTFAPSSAGHSSPVLTGGGSKHYLPTSIGATVSPMIRLRSESIRSVDMPPAVVTSPR